MENKRTSFLGKYLKSTFETNKLPQMLLEKSSGRMYLLGLIIILSIVLTIAMMSVFPKAFNEKVQKLPEFKISNGNIELKEKSEDKFLKYDIRPGVMYPNITLEEYTDFVKEKEHEKVKDENKDENTKKNTKQDSKEQQEANKEDIKEKENITNENKIDELINTEYGTILLFKDGILLKGVGWEGKYINLLNTSGEITKEQITNQLEVDLKNTFRYAVFFSNFLSMLLFSWLLNILGKIYTTFTLAFSRKKRIYVGEYIFKMLRYLLSAPLTIYTILFALTITEKIADINYMLVSFIIYLIYIEVVKRILDSDKHFQIANASKVLKFAYPEGSANQKQEEKIQTVDEWEESKRKVKEELEKQRKAKQDAINKNKDNKKETEDKKENKKENNKNKDKNKKEKIEE